MCVCVRVVPMQGTHVAVANGPHLKNLGWGHRLNTSFYQYAYMMYIYE